MRFWRRLLCWFYGHEWSEWEPWIGRHYYDDDAGEFVPVPDSEKRWCVRCRWFAARRIGMGGA